MTMRAGCHLGRFDRPAGAFNFKLQAFKKFALSLRKLTPFEPGSLQISTEIRMLADGSPRLPGGITIAPFDLELPERPCMRRHRMRKDRDFAGQPGSTAVVFHETKLEQAFRSFDSKQHLEEGAHGRWQLGTV